MSVNYSPIDTVLCFRTHESLPTALWKQQITLYLITFSETNLWSSIQLEKLHVTVLYHKDTVKWDTTENVYTVIKTMLWSSRVKTGRPQYGKWHFEFSTGLSVRAATETVSS